MKLLAVLAMAAISGLRSPLAHGSPGRSSCLTTTAAPRLATTAPQDGGRHRGDLPRSGGRLARPGEQLSHRGSVPERNHGGDWASASASG
jgi:hypothetical protein